MVEVIWYFSQGLGVVTSSGRIEWGGKERREERELRTEGKESRGGQGERKRGKMEAHEEFLGDAGESDRERGEGRGDMGLLRKGVGVVSEGKTRGRRSKEAKRGWRKEGEKRKRRRRNKGTKE